MTEQEFKFGDLVDATFTDGTYAGRGVVIDIDVENDRCTVWIQGQEKHYSWTSWLLTLVARPSRGGRMVQVNYDDLKDDEPYYLKLCKNNGTSGTYRYVEGAAPAEPSVATCKRVLLVHVVEQRNEARTAADDLDKLADAVNQIKED